MAVNQKKVSRRKVVLRGDYFIVEQTDIVLPEKKKATHLNVIRYPSVCIFPLTKDYELYLASQYRYLYNKVSIEAIGGFVNKGESSLQAAERELKEEAGLSAVQWEEIARVDYGASVIKASVHLFLAKDLEQSASSQDEYEDISVIRLSLEEAVERVLQQQITESATVAGILLLDLLRKRKKI